MAGNFEDDQNNQNNLNNYIKQYGKDMINKKAKTVALSVAKFVAPVIAVFLIIIIVVTLISSLIHELTLQKGEYRDNDWTSIPYAVSKFTSEITVDEDGKIYTSMTAKEIWDKLKENKSDVDEYLSGPKDLLKLMNAEVVTNYPDTRENPDEPIDWNSINQDVNSNLTQGIVKFKRAKSDGSTSTMIYKDPDTFYSWIEQYNETGSEDIKQLLLTHYTLEKNINYASTNSETISYNNSDIITDISERIVAAAKITPSIGTNLCQGWVRQVYANAGLGNVYYNKASDAYRANVVSNDINTIPIGAAVYGTGSGRSDAGHVGIYIGNGMVMDNVNDKVQTTKLEDWVGWQERRGYSIDGKVGWLGWGWQAGKPTQILSNGITNNENNQEQSSETIDAIPNIEMKLIENNGKITFYNGDGSAMEGGSNNAQSYALEVGQGAMSLKNYKQYKNSVIYVETTNSGEGSAANGKFIYITDNGGGVKNNQIDVYANVDQKTMNKSPYGTYNGAKFYLVEQNVKYEDFKSKYLNKSGNIQAEGNNSNGSKSKYSIVVASWNETQKTVTSNDESVTETSESIYTASTQKINYQDMVSKYTMPFEYLWALIIVGQGKNFSLDLADLVYNSQIEFTVYDNLTITTNTEHHDYTKEVTVETENGPSTTTKSYRTTYKTISKINVLNVSLTKANTWIVDYNQNYTYEVPKEVTTSGDKINEGKETISTTNKVEKKNYVSSPASIKEKIDPKSSEDNFITLFKKKKNNKITSNIVSGAEWLFEILERNKNSISTDLIDLTKYLLYIATGEEYGVTNFDFSIFKPGSFNSVSGIYGNTTEEKVWFSLRNAGYSEIATSAVMGNIKYESGFDASLIEAGNGIGYGLCQWSYGRRENLEAYANSKGVNVSDIQTQIEFLLAELNPSGGANGYAKYQMGNKSSSKYDGRTYIESDWKDASDVKTATIAFMAIFEKPSYDESINHKDGRVSEAQSYYNKFKGKTAPTSDKRIGKITLSEPKATTMAAMLSDAIRIAEDDRYTYSQANRYGEYQYDCSSFVNRLYKQFFNIDVPSTTSGYSTNSTAYMGTTGNVELQPGDVLWKSGHVEIYLGNGLKVGARSAKIAIKDQIKIDNYSEGQFTHVYRFIK